MKELTEKLIFEIRKSHSGGFGTKTKWDSIFDNEQELIETMLAIKSDPDKIPYNKLPKGYEYIEGFKKYYNKNGCLTEKQITQLKRLATEIAYVSFVVNK